jgi:hypothetical protein
LSIPLEPQSLEYPLEYCNTGAKEKHLAHFFRSSGGKPVLWPALRNDWQASVLPLALEIRADTTGATGMMAEELRSFCRVVRRLQGVPVGATDGDALQVQQWMDKLESGLDN